MNKANVEDTYAEAFSGIFSRLIITAGDASTLKTAAQDATATPSVVVGRLEGGIERYLRNGETPDKRKGALLQFWGQIDETKPFSESLGRFEKELSFRIRQDILVKPFTSVFDALTDPEGKLDMMTRVGHCGDGYEWVEKRFGREVIIVPLMVPDFIVEHYIGYARGVMGANFWVLCNTKRALRKMSKRTLQAIHNVAGTITPFDICSAGSKPETHFPWIGPTTNHPYCPSLKHRLGKESKIPENTKYIPEIVINAVSLDAAKLAMKVGIETALETDGVSMVSAGNYGGKLGGYKIFLRELVS
jgi:formylmethanofuran--tetrahydromethanopterin N-formyltransferase